MATMRRLALSLAVTLLALCSAASPGLVFLDSSSSVSVNETCSVVVEDSGDVTIVLSRDFPFPRGRETKFVVALKGEEEKEKELLRVLPLKVNKGDGNGRKATAEPNKSNGKKRKIKSMIAPSFKMQISVSSQRDLVDAMLTCPQTDGCTINLISSNIVLEETIEVFSPARIISSVGTVVRGGGGFRLFNVRHPSVSFSGITFTAGNSFPISGLRKKDQKKCTKFDCMGGALLLGAGNGNAFNPGQFKKQLGSGYLASIVNCTFEYNSAIGGGAIAVIGGFKLGMIRGCTFRGNKAVGLDGDDDLNAFTLSGGAAIAVLDAAIHSIEDCKFENNLAAYGGAVRAVSSSLGRRKNLGETRIQQIKDSYFSQNSASQQGGAVYVSGAGMATIERCTFSENRVDLSSGGSAIFYQGPNPPERIAIMDCKFDEHLDRDNGRELQAPHPPPNTVIRFDSEGVFLINNTGLLDNEFGGLCGQPASCPSGHVFKSSFNVSKLIFEDEQLENETRFENISTEAEVIALRKERNELWMGSICEECPVNTFLAKTLSLSNGNLLAECTPCDDGTSTQGMTGQTQCIPCSTMYAFSKHCTTPWLGVLLGALTALIIGLLVLSLILLRQTFTTIVKDKEQKIMEKDTKLEKQGVELNEQVRENKGLKASWLIEESEITYVKPVGQGTFAVVYLGTWTGEDVAIKELKKKAPKAILEDAVNISSVDSSASTSSLSSLEVNEVKNMLLVRHPRIVRFHGAGVKHYADHSKHFLVYEWMGGGSLRSKLAKRGAHNWHWKLRIALDVALGIKFLHKRSFVHRDVKTDNILLDDNDRAKLADFGTGRAINMGAGAADMSTEALKLLDSNDMMTAKHGTVLYMAPELLVAIIKKEKKVKMSFKTDIFALGLVLWELMSEQIPWTELLSRPRNGQSVMSIVVKETIKGNRPTIPKLRVMPPDNYLALIKLCWAHNPDDRPNIHQVVAVLNKLVNGDRRTNGSMSSSSIDSEDVLRLDIASNDSSVAAASTIDSSSLGRPRVSQV